jgi:2-phosphoglycerate kinase
MPTDKCQRRRFLQQMRSIAEITTGQMQRISEHGVPTLDDTSVTHSLHLWLRKITEDRAGKNCKSQRTRIPAAR